MVLDAQAGAAKYADTTTGPPVLYQLISSRPGSTGTATRGAAGVTLTALAHNPAV